MTRTAYRSFGDFYPFHLTEHSKSATRRLHFAGTRLVLLTLAGDNLSHSSARL